MQRSGKCKTSDFFGQKYGCFASKVRMFPSKKSDVFVFRKGYSALTLSLGELFKGTDIMSECTSSTRSFFILGGHSTPTQLVRLSVIVHSMLTVYLCPWLSGFQPSPM